MTSWPQLVLTVAEQDSLRIQEVLLGEGAIGLEIDDDETRSIPEKPVVKTHEAKIVATFEAAKGLADRVSTKLDLLHAHIFEMSWRELADGDWVNAFQKSWKTFSIANGIWIVPSWEMVLHMDPGMAFGTGHHETTTLCAQAVQEAVTGTTGLKVLDVGTGTGILAMIAAKLGAERVVATDNDPLACEVARENCAKNGVSHIEVSELEPDAWGPLFDVVVANILALPLIELAPQIVRALAPGGKLFLSGVLNSQEPAVRQAYVDQGLTHVKTASNNEWVLIEFRF